MKRAGNCERRRTFQGQGWERKNRPPAGEPWIWLTREMLISPAWRALSSASRDIVLRITVEHMDQGGMENGRLVVTYDDFAAFGIRRKTISTAREEAEALGFIHIIDRGRGGNADFRRASRYALTWLPTADGELPTNQWKAFSTVEEARAAVAARLTRRRSRSVWQSRSVITAQTGAPAKI